MWLRVVVALLVLVTGGAFAQPGATAIRGAVRSYSEAEVLQFARLQNVSKAVSWGKVIRYGGVVVGAASLLYSALDWFYQEAQRATGSSLDGWREGINSGGVAITAGVRLSYPGESYAYYQTWFSYPDKKGGQVFGGDSVGRVVPYKSAVTETDWRDVFYEAYGSRYRDGWCALFCGDGYFALPNSYVVTGSVSPYCGTVGGVAARCYLMKTYAGLDDWIDTHADAGPAAREVLGDYLDHLEQQPGWPYTYGAPYGPDGVEVTPAPNINQWYDNPYANPGLDTDGDGWPDWKEVAGGTDPLNPGDYPAYDPVPGEGPDGDPLPDRDGDGIPDVYDPCPAQASNACMDGSEPGPELEIPDDYMRDATGQAQLDVLRDILEELRRDEQEEEDFAAGQPDAPMPELSPLSAPSLTWSVLEAVGTQMEGAATGWWSEARTRLPFALGVGWLPAAPSVSTGSCEGVQMTILGEPQEVGLCGTAIDAFLAGPGRAVLLAALLVGFYLATAQVVTRL